MRSALKGEIYLKKPADFTRLHKLGKYLGSRLVLLKSAPNSLLHARWAIITSKKLGNSVIRNTVKRHLREIMRQANLKPGYDIVLIGRAGAPEAGFSELRKTVEELLNLAGLIMADETTSPVTD